jgi:hypothetical protein
LQEEMALGFVSIVSAISSSATAAMCLAWRNACCAKMAISPPAMVTLPHMMTMVLTSFLFTDEAAMMSNLYPVSYVGALTDPLW